MVPKKSEQKKVMEGGRAANGRQCVGLWGES